MSRDSHGTRGWAKYSVGEFSLEAQWDIPPGQVAALFGPSGAGKSTTLRIIAGLVRPDSGHIEIGGRVVFDGDTGTMVPVHRRRTGYLTQQFHLFPHLKAGANIAYGLSGAKSPAGQDRVRQMIQTLRLQGLEDRYPWQLSGGQQQRVALARALAPKPDVVLLDEPFSNLDLDSRERMGQEISDEFKANNVTCVIVTHDQNDAFALGDEVGVMSAGAIVQWDTPYNLYHQPVDRFVADFIGNGVFLPGQVISKQAVHTQLSELTRSTALDWPVGTEVEVLIRPDDVVQDPDRTIEATVIRRAFKGAEILYTLKADANTILLALFPSHTNFGIGEKVGVRLEVDHLVAFPRQSAEELNKRGSS